MFKTVFICCAICYGSFLFGSGRSAALSELINRELSAIAAAGNDLPAEVVELERVLRLIYENPSVLDNDDIYDNVEWKANRLRIDSLALLAGSKKFGDKGIDKNISYDLFWTFYPGDSVALLDFQKEMKLYFCDNFFRYPSYDNKLMPLYFIDNLRFLATHSQGDSLLDRRVADLLMRFGAVNDSFFKGFDVESSVKLYYGSGFDDEVLLSTILSYSDVVVRPSIFFSGIVSFNPSAYRSYVNSALVRLVQGAGGDRIIPYVDYLQMNDIKSIVGDADFAVFWKAISSSYPDIFLGWVLDENGSIKYEGNEENVFSSLWTYFVDLK